MYGLMQFKKQSINSLHFKQNNTIIISANNPDVALLATLRSTPNYYWASAFKILLSVNIVAL